MTLSFTTYNKHIHHHHHRLSPTNQSNQNNAMETRSAKRRKLRNPYYSSENNNTGEDRITDLPDAVLHHILFLLPIKSIVQTSILSKRWRTIWYTFPDLDFTSVIPSGTALSNSIYTKNIGNEITKILSLRDKLSDVRILRFCASMTFSGLHALIRNAVRLRVQELDIWVATKDTFNLPRSLISHDCLRVLKMKSYPGFRLPPSMIMKSGFQTLQTLSLSFVYLDNQSSLLDMFTDSSFLQLRKLSLDYCFNLKQLRVGCGLLEELVIGNCSSLQGLEISSPRLKTLTVSNCFTAAYFDTTCFEIDTPRLHTIVWSNNSITSKNSMQNLVCLHDVTIGFLVTQDILDADKLQRISNFLSGLPHTVSLTVESPLIEIMSKNNPLAAIFFSPFEKLKSLELRTNEVPCLPSVLKVCPMIHTLIIKNINRYRPDRRWNRLAWDLSSSWEEQRWESLTNGLKPLLHHLVVLKIHGFTENEISLIKFFLKHGKVLQDFILYLGDYNSRGYYRPEKLKSRIMEFPRASIDAKLAFH